MKAQFDIMFKKHLFIKSLEKKVVNIQLEDHVFSIDSKRII